MREWSPDSWRKRSGHQTPNWCSEPDAPDDASRCRFGWVHHSPSTASETCRALDGEMTRCRLRLDHAGPCRGECDGGESMEYPTHALGEATP